jgi:hypothetical protein
MHGRQSPADAWMDEEVKFKAFMRLEVFPAYVNQLGTREFQFIIRDWELYGKSEMLNRLFYGDPRGRFVEDPATGFADFVPAIVTFNVSQNYHLGVDPEHGLDPSEIFGDARGFEIRNLTSHHLRVWTPGAEGRRDAEYANPNNMLYWQVLSPASFDKSSFRFLWPGLETMSGATIGKENPLIVFHKKAPGIPGEDDTFDIANARDRARYLLAISAFAPLREVTPGGRLMAAATLPVRGLNANLVQLPGNSVLSSLYRARQPLDIRFSLASSIRSAGDLGEIVAKKVADSGRKMLTGWIKLVDPSKSLATADQAPEPGQPFDSADLPARITYAINYDVHINNQKLVDDQAGIAIAVGAEEIPPRDVKVAFEKPQAGHLMSRHVYFRPGCCTGMLEIAEREFADGVNFARYSRTVPLDPEAISLNSATPGATYRDYDPNLSY